MRFGSGAGGVSCCSTMTSRSSSRIILFIACFLCARVCSGFSVSRSRVSSGSRASTKPPMRSQCFTTLQCADKGDTRTKAGGAACAAHEGIYERNADLIHFGRRRVRLMANKSDNKDEIEIIGLGDDTISDKAWEDIEAGAPSESTIMKELLGINIFTYILGAACIFFLSMNAILGPGWLGQVAGIQGTGSFTDISDSLPGNVDLNNFENLLF